MWGFEKWGQLIWGGHAVPGLSVGMLLILMGCCFAAGGYFLRPGSKTRRGSIAAALLLLLPISVAAVTLPYSFSNGTIADASQVNANFTAITNALDVASCPVGMTRIEMPYTILCGANGPVATWDNASNYCWDSYRAHLCSPQQWRDAVCIAGLSSPGASWTNAQTGALSAGAITGCTTESFSSIPTTSQRVAACCLEWARY